MIELIGYALLMIGGFCSIAGSIGLLRFPDVYNRIHANTVVVVGGAITSILGVSIMGGLSSFTLKAALIALFLFITSPVTSHAIARAAHRSGVKLWEKSVADRLKEVKK
ncbi:MAG: monovalent cation/H(+) antiporter subunit G [Candidatus Hadarchaeales archaeon]